MKRVCLFILVFGMGCSEYDLTGDEVVYGDPNPPELETPIYTDQLVQSPITEVDILWVIDTSCSMEEEQVALTENFSQFMGYFVDSGLDYHIGVISMDMDSHAHEGKLRSVAGYKWIDADTPNPVGIFSQMAYMGINGSTAEKGRAAAYTALELLQDDYNSGFLREDAALHVVAISDENDQSGTYPISLNEFVGFLQNLKWLEDMVTFSAITGPRDGCSTAYEPGVEYHTVIDEVGGVNWSICTEEWDYILKKLGMQAAGITQEFFLTEVPVPGSLVVTVFDEGITYAFEEDEDWVYDRSRNSILFLGEYIPEPLSVISIQYEVLAAYQDEMSSTGSGQ